MSKRKERQPWHERFLEVLEYKKKHKKLPTKVRTSTDRYLHSLALWVTNQRRSYRAGRLSGEQARLLNSIEFIRHKEIREEEKWNNHFERLKNFRTANPDKWPSGYSDDRSERSLAKWCDYNRSYYKGTIKNLFSAFPEKRKRMLDSIGFHWNYDEKWHTMYNELKTYRKKNPNRWPPVKMIKLYNWMRSQRQSYRKGILSQNSIDLLNEIKFQWNPGKKIR